MKNEGIHDDVEFRSPEIQEIIGRVPGYITRWGITIIFIALILFGSLSFIIKYPDLVSAKVVVTTTPPPIILVTRSSGELHLAKREKDVVQKGDLLGYIGSTASLADVLSIEKQVNGTMYVDATLVKESLGELQTYFASLISAQASLRSLQENALYDKQISLLEKQIATYTKMSQGLHLQQSIAQQELKLAREKFETDSLLFRQNVISALDFNSSKTFWLQQQRNARSNESSILNIEAQSNITLKQISDIEVQEKEQFEKSRLAVDHAKGELISQISKWKQMYTFFAPTSGRLAYLGFLEERQFIESNKSIFSILPDEGKFVGKAELPIRGSGKVKEGQSVNIQLENYPHEQFGTLSGRVISISEMHDQDKYWITIDLPDQLLTNQGRELTFRHQLSGTTEIITDDLRLIDRLFFRLSSLVRINR